MDRLAGGLNSVDHRVAKQLIVLWRSSEKWVVWQNTKGMGESRERDCDALKMSNREKAVDAQLGYWDKQTAVTEVHLEGDTS